MGVIVFFAAFVIFYALLNSKPDEKISNLNQDASLVISQIASDEAVYKVVDANEINVSRLNQLKNTSYDELKRLLRVEGEFCIYLEDDGGFIVLINNSYGGIGSSNVNLSGVPCSQK